MERIRKRKKPDNQISMDRLLLDKYTLDIINCLCYIWKIMTVALYAKVCVFCLNKSMV